MGERDNHKGNVRFGRKSPRVTWFYVPPKEGKHECSTDTIFFVINLESGLLGHCSTKISFLAFFLFAVDFCIRLFGKQEVLLCGLWWPARRRVLRVRRVVWRSHGTRKSARGVSGVETRKGPASAGYWLVLGPCSSLLDMACFPRVIFMNVNIFRSVVSKFTKMLSLCDPFFIKTKFL